MNESSFRRALADTLQAHHGVRFYWIVDVLAGLSGTMLGTLATPENADRLQTAFYPALGGLIGLITAVVILFLFNLVAAPYRQRDEAQKELAELKQIEENQGVVRLYNLHYQPESDANEGVWWVVTDIVRKDGTPLGIGSIVIERCSVELQILDNDTKQMQTARGKVKLPNGLWDTEFILDETEEPISLPLVFLDDIGVAGIVDAFAPPRDTTRITTGHTYELKVLVKRGRRVLAAKSYCIQHLDEYRVVGFPSVGKFAEEGVVELGNQETVGSATSI